MIQFYILICAVTLGLMTLAACQGHFPMGFN